MHLRSLESAEEVRVTLGYSLEQLLRFFCALQTSRVHPEVDMRRLSIYQFFNPVLVLTEFRTTIYNKLT